MKFIKNYPFFKSILILLSVTSLVTSCRENSSQDYYLVYGKEATEIEMNTVQDLAEDLKKVTDKNVQVIPETDELGEGIIFILGTPESNRLVAKAIEEKKIQLSKTSPGPRGGIWDKVQLKDKKEVLVIAGSDVQGLQYAIYDYSKIILEVDPFEYWTSNTPEQKTSEQITNFAPRTIAPPKVPLLCYFENDVDELANYRGKLLEYDWESYTEMINSLVRLKYNAIQLFDMLGRPEFFLRPEYQKLNPDYKLDLVYLEKMIDYAQSKGMKVAVDFALGYQINPMSANKATCWKEYREDWLNAWRYYLEETPLKKTDIFMLRPRHQVWDWEYESTCGENKIDVFNEVYKTFGNLVEAHKPQADKVLICYADGMQMWNDGFRPPKDWIVCWSDDGFGDFELLPNTTDDYNFGTYMHAGFWLNHTVHNPYPEKIESEMKAAFSDLKADKFCLVNGQNFRPFILNIEAYSAVCNAPKKFTSASFYKDWTARYFNEREAEHAIGSMKLLNEAQSVSRIGYVQHLWEIREAIAYLSNSPIERPGKSPVSYTFRRVENDIENTQNIKVKIELALKEAEKGLKVSGINDNFYHSYIYLPALLYNDLIAFETTLHQMSKLKRKFETTGNNEALEKAIDLQKVLKLQLNTLHQNRKDGDLNPKWDRWYDIDIRRPNNGFPTEPIIAEIAKNLNTLAI